MTGPTVIKQSRHKFLRMMPQLLYFQFYYEKGEGSSSVTETIINQVWQYTPMITLLGRLRQRHFKPNAKPEIQKALSQKQTIILFNYTI